MPRDDVASSVIPRRWPSHHSGPGYVANPVAPDFELDEPLRGAAARWLNLVPAEHRHEGRESATGVLETLRAHDAALESRAAIAIKGAPEQHAEGANVPGDEDR